MAAAWQRRVSLIAPKSVLQSDVPLHIDRTQWDGTKAAKQGNAENGCRVGNPARHARKEDRLMLGSNYRKAKKGETSCAECRYVYPPRPDSGRYRYRCTDIYMRGPGYMVGKTMTCSVAEKR